MDDLPDDVKKQADEAVGKKKPAPKPVIKETSPAYFDGGLRVEVNPQDDKAPEQTRDKVKLTFGDNYSGDEIRGITLSPGKVTAHYAQGLPNKSYSLPLAKKADGKEYLFDTTEFTVTMAKPHYKNLSITLAKDPDEKRKLAVTLAETAIPLLVEDLPLSDKKWPPRIMMDVTKSRENTEINHYAATHLVLTGTTYAQQKKAAEKAKVGKEITLDLEGLAVSCDGHGTLSCVTTEGELQEILKAPPPEISSEPPPPKKPSRRR